MPEMRTGFIRIKRDTGSDALIRADAVTHILHNTFMKKVGAAKVETACLSLHLGQTLVIHTEMTEEQLLTAMASAAAIGKIPVIDTAE